MSEIYPVVHINNPDTAREEATVALESGADGIYLIDHAARHDVVFDTYANVRSQHPDAYIGMNLLGYGAVDATWTVKRAIDEGRIPQSPNGLWIDDIDDDRYGAPGAMEIKRAHDDLARMRILGGIAFKYTHTFTEDPEMAARETDRLRSHVDVVTTSGAGTGHAPTPAKIAAMHSRLDGKRLAVASGISEQNIHLYGGNIDEILVSSSVETEPYSGVFDRKKLASMIEAAHQDSARRD